MNRYYLVHDDNLPNFKQASMLGIWNYIPLDSHGTVGADWNLIVLHDESKQPLDTWQVFPSLLSRKTLAESDIDQTLLADLGFTGEETTIEFAEIVGAIFTPFQP